MNGLLKINYKEEKMSVTDICEVLDQCNDFTQFFIACSEMKVQFDREGLRILIDALRKYYSKYGAESIAYLIDSIHAEMALPCNNVVTRKLSESTMRKRILDNFDKIFPECDHIQIEKNVKGIGRIDIYTEKNGRTVIIELKIGRKNPNQQLLAYSAGFENPILIGITEFPLDEEQKISGIEYFSLHELEKTNKKSRLIKSDSHTQAGGTCHRLHPIRT